MALRGGERTRAWRQPCGRAHASTKVFESLVAAVAPRLVLRLSTAAQRGPVFVLSFEQVFVDLKCTLHPHLTAFDDVDVCIETRVTGLGSDAELLAAELNALCRAHFDGAIAKNGNRDFFRYGFSELDRGAGAT